ncbi:porin family protein [Desulfurispirillum indicum]|uniref:outer membrane beta-barrel protein n=1 Tax=Desulfurispirillum indicum TaxID=936456 RepID=UPI001CFB0318|nr:outer membrane beta-barrel protein [Desulfurispirillum indicum]UCZ57710.1 porin family protein [Desulfurispirillum indicum]
MKRRVTRILAIAMTLAAVSTAAKAESYVKAQMGITSPDGMDSGTILVLTYGMPRPDKQNVTYEFEFATTMTEPEEKYTIWGVTTTADLSYSTAAGYMVYGFPFGQKFSTNARIGLIYESLEVTASNAGASASSSETKFGFSFGLGLDYALTERTALTVNYTALRSNIDHTTLGIKYTF